MLDLPFDAMIPNTKLAEIYFKAHNNVFYDGDITDNVRLNVTDGINTIKSTKDVTHLIKQNKENIERRAADVHPTDIKLVKLRNEIIENANLFSQVEFLIRKIPIDDVLNYDLKLISQNILHNTATSFTTPLRKNCLSMDACTPLSHLGYVVQILRKFNSCLIRACKLTAVICHLFVELCHKVGLNEVQLIFTENPSSSSECLISLDPYKFKMGKGCVGVITENGDMDSAVDVLIETPIWHPWRLGRILVQESVYTGFKKAMRWKTEECPKEVEPMKSCAEAFRYKGRTFLLDYTRTDNTDQSIIVESYRTTKELLSLLNNYDNFFMSLWTNCLTESNEITHYASSGIIWINHIGVFDGPPQASQAIYGTAGSKYCQLECFYVHKNWDVQLKNWLKLTFQERCNKIISCLLECSENFSQLKNSMDGLKDWQPSSVYVENGKVCVCTTKSINMICYKRIKPDELSEFTATIRLLALGTAILIDNSESDIVVEFTKRLKAIGAPFLTFNTTKFEDSVAIEAINLSANDFLSATKVVYSNFGTIFAN